MDVDRCAGGLREPSMAGYVVGVVVGLEHVLDPNTVKAAEPQIRVDVPLGIDDHGDADALVAGQVRPATEVLVDHLAKEHRSLSSTLPGRRPARRPRRAGDARPRRPA